MGQRLVALAHEDPELTIGAAWDHAEHPQQGTDAGVLAGIGEIGIPLSPSLTTQVDVVVDFSVAAAVAPLVQACQQRKIPVVVATTGLSEADEQLVRTVAETIPVVWAPSMSLAVNLLMKLTQLAAETLQNQTSGVDFEIIERHHRFKEDSPSGTALKFGQIIAEATGIDRQTHGREGRPGARPRNEIGYHAVRVGDNPGEHTIVMGMLGETLELRVAASNRDCYASGALSAAKFLAQQPPGLYDMSDVLGL